MFNSYQHSKGDFEDLIVEEDQMCPHAQSGTAVCQAAECLPNRFLEHNITCTVPADSKLPVEFQNANEASKYQPLNHRHPFPTSMNNYYF